MPNLSQAIEALLFVSEREMSVKEIAKTLDQPVDKIETELKALESSLYNHAIKLCRSGQNVSLITDPELAGIVEPFAREERQKPLSSSALETLAVVIYEQPITKAGIDKRRGVNSEQSLASLIQKGLVQESGRSPEAGRPVLYQASTLALKQLGISSPNDLPKLEELSEA